MAKTEEEKAAAKLAKDAEKEAKKKTLVLKNVFGDEVEEDDYFFAKEDEKGNMEKGAPSYFNRTCGMPVDREDLLDVFKEIFDSNESILFYKSMDKEIYIVIVPIKYASTIGTKHDSQAHDFQKHAISFIGEGSVNIDTMRMKLQRVASTIKIKN